MEFISFIILNALFNSICFTLIKNIILKKGPIGFMRLPNRFITQRSEEPCYKDMIIKMVWYRLGMDKQNRVSIPEINIYFNTRFMTELRYCI